MTFENPQIPEGINTSKEHPFREFIWLLAGAVLLILIVVTLLGWFGSSLARLIPFETELKISQQFDPPENPNDQLYLYLDGLKDQITAAMDLDDSFRILLRYKEDDTVNAFATLGGNVILFRGLLKELPHENALVMLMAHEIAHVQHRDPVVGMGRGVFVQLGMSALLGNTPALENVFGQAGMLHIMRYTRKMESAADEAALAALQRIYGHVNGSTDLFTVLSQLRKTKDAKEPVEFFSTHPLDQNRIDRIKMIAKDNLWDSTGSPKALPDFFQSSVLQ